MFCVFYSLKRNGSTGVELGALCLPGRGSTTLPCPQPYNLKLFKFFSFFFAVLGFELKAYTLSHSTSLFFFNGFS
jgi:hypothetical protein